MCVVGVGVMREHQPHTLLLLAVKSNKNTTTTPHTPVVLNQVKLFKNIDYIAMHQFIYTSRIVSHQIVSYCNVVMSSRSSNTALALTTLAAVGVGALASYFGYRYYQDNHGAKKYKVVFVLGGPGSGKGTNCSKIVDNFGYVHLSAGDLLRAARSKGSELADLINSYIRDGKIVPAEITVGLLHDAMEKSGNTKFLVDGFPRDMQNLECWQSKMEPFCDVQFLLFLDCPEEVMTERLLERGKDSGRSDDNVESIKKRLVVYEQSTKPIIEYYKSQGKMRQVDSNRLPDQVFAEVSVHFASANH